MSGHSKWAKIHRAKEVSDQKRGQSFTKLSNAITLAVREGGGIGDPNFNFKLRLAIEKAREANMPKDNIQRAIDRATGKLDGSSLEEVTYEAYGPAGVGFLVQTVSDNRQRTVQEIKNIFDRSGGSVASPGSVSFNFKKTGHLEIETLENSEEAMLKIMDLGDSDIEDIEDAGDGMVDIYVEPDTLIAVKDRLAVAGFKVKTAEIVQKPLNFITVTDERTANSLLNLVDRLESSDDVQKVFANFDITEELLPKI